MKLVIVESPTKAKTISKFLGGGDFVVKSSFGHIRDLPKSKLGIDIAHDFEPTYVIPAKAKKVVTELKADTDKADEVILATDPDREGEAIAWHLVQALGLNNLKIKNSKLKIGRVVFHEITKHAIQEAMEHPRGLDQNLVDAQQARRVLDRLVGYKLSPFLWKKIRSGLSAGRVQSVAVRLVVEREREIQTFKAQEYWSVEADLSKRGKDKIFRARLIKDGEKTLDKLAIKNEAEAQKILKALNGAEYQVSSITKKEINRNPAAPFTTSTLQQEASRKLGFSAKQTMTLAQKLYETGLITYMRTDSHNISQIALTQAREVIEKQFGKKYTLDKPRFYTNKSKGAQEAHEAIRPTDLSKLPDEVRISDIGQRKLYDLIWKRTIACQMQPAVFDQTAVDIIAKADRVALSNRATLSTNTYTFRANGQIVLFDGFIRAYTEGKDEDEDEESDMVDLSAGRQEAILPDLSEKEILNLIKLLKEQHFTEPPPRYTDATLVKTLEAAGVGRPSTYAPTLATIQDRGYVEKEEKKYKPTEIGFLVNDMLVENFPEVVDINFTSHIEEEFDDIAEGKMKWQPVIEEFWSPFKKNLDEKTESVEKLTEESDIPCPHCGKKMLIKFGRFGKFLSCPDDPKITQPLPEEQKKIDELTAKTRDERCPVCGKAMEIKRGRFGYFLGCVDYPTCKGIAKILNRTGFKCPACGTGDIVEKKSRGRGRAFYACSRWPDCNFIMSAKPESEPQLAEAYKKWKLNPPKVRKSRWSKNKKAASEATE